MARLNDDALYRIQRAGTILIGAKPDVIDASFHRAPFHLIITAGTDVYAYAFGHNETATVCGLAGKEVQVAGIFVLTGIGGTKSKFHGNIRQLGTISRQAGYSQTVEGMGIEQHGLVVGDHN